MRDRQVVVYASRKLCVLELICSTYDKELANVVFFMI